MPFPSIQTIFQATRQTLVRFPLAVLCAVAGTALAQVVIYRGQQPADTLLTAALCMFLGISVFLAATLFAESRSLGRWQRAGLYAGAAALLAAATASVFPVADEVNAIRFMLLAAAFHLAVSIAPRVGAGGFWEFNKLIFLRFLLAQLYSWVLFGGLAIAIGASDYLFGLDASDKTYGYLLVFTLGVFNTLFFLGGVPNDFAALEPEYPRPLKLFTQYVLIPLAIVYLAIILVYEAKVVATWVLPKGIIATLILGYGVYGILSLLLVYPVRGQEGNQWIGTYSRLFYFLLLPLIPLLAVAIGVRAGHYGWTEPRYLVMITAAWLLFITVYNLFKGQENIRFIPASLLVVAVISAWGPQSATPVSRSSQQAQLVKIFEQHGLWRDGQLQPVPASVPDSTAGALGAHLGYLVRRYGAASVHPLVADSLRQHLLRADTLASRQERHARQAAFLIKSLGLSQRGLSARSEPEFYFALAAADSLSLAGYRWLQHIHTGQAGEIALRAGDTLHIAAAGVPAIQVAMRPLLESIELAAGRAQNQPWPPAELQLASETASQQRLVVQFLEIRYKKTDRGRQLTHVRAALLHP